MPISHTLKCIFIHIPKCAGTSIEKALNMFDNNELFGYDENNKIAKQHLTSKQVLEYIPKKIFDDYFKFAFVRNPYDRAVSSAAYHKIDLIDFLTNSSKFDGKILHKIPFKQHLTQHLKPQNDYCYSLDFVGRYENLEDDWNTITGHLGINVKLKRENQSQHDNYRKYYLKKEKELVDNLYKEDFELFGYQYKKFAAIL